MTNRPIGQKIVPPSLDIKGKWQLPPRILKLLVVKKTRSNSTHSPPEKRRAKRHVVTNISDRKNRGAIDSVAKSNVSAALSTAGIDLTALEAAIERLPELDAARVVELHNRIVADEYKIDARRVANKLLDLESLL